LQAFEQSAEILPGEFFSSDSHYLPAFGAKAAVHPPVASPVGGNLHAPEGGVGLGFGPMPEATVPEAADHKHRHVEPGEDEVRPDPAGGADV
jgi:hypothetical protein